MWHDRQKEENMEDKLLHEKKSGWLQVDDTKRNEIFNFGYSYIDFLNQAKTEREAAEFIVEALENSGFKNIDLMGHLHYGDKVYMINRDKSVYAAIIGHGSITEGVNMVGAHIDSPRLDLKPNPLYEDVHLALFKTHYYGGIKKYQWTTTPLALHGVVAKTNGEKITISIGEEEGDPVFTITDLLPHLAIKQREKKLEDAIEGEGLNVLVGSIPNDAKEEAVKANIMHILHEKYGMKEIDFCSSEFEIVPAFKARHLGFDQSMVGSYGQDDRVCAYTTLQALLYADIGEHTAVAIFADKEEIGSMGNTGMYSEMFDYFMYELLDKKGENTPSALNRTYCNSMMLSADVGTGIDPNYQEASEANNASYIGYGVELNKYTGSRGKSGASDASAEFVAYVREIFESHHIPYQVSELGKVDLGGGGTIAFILANKGVDVIDCGVPVLSMHSPFEVTSKYDIYSAYEAYKAFFEE